MKQLILTTYVLLTTSAFSHSVKAATIAEQTAKEIRTEALRQNNDPAGHALPLLASWNTGWYRYYKPGQPRGLDPDFQMDQIEKGHHILPSFFFPQYDNTEAWIPQWEEYYKPALQRAAQLNLPITLVGVQWEQELTFQKKYFDLPPDQNPNVITSDDKVLKELSPFGPVDLWREVGTNWVTTPIFEQLEKWYPNPPQVTLLSNNESSKLRWEEVDKDKRYQEKYGKDHDIYFQHKVMGEGWIERFRAMQNAMRNHLNPAWQSKVLFVAYDAFGSRAFGSWDGQMPYSPYIPGRVTPFPLMWDGSSPSYYTDDWNPGTDFRVYSPQVQTMNWVFMQREALKLNPNFRFNFSLWNGEEYNSKRSEQYQPKPDYYRSLRQTYNPTRYAGFAQFGLWLLRPRVMREYRGTASDLTSMEPYFHALENVVDHVYKNKTLQKFWRKGELVPNRAHQHPYHFGIPNEYKNVDRWFLLDTNLDAPRPWKLDTEIPVFSLALVEGDKGNRRWLVYAHSSLQDRQGVVITIPDYGKITVNVSMGGTFYTVDEKSKKVYPVL